MKSIVMKIHNHDNSTRVTIPKEIIRSQKWEKEDYLIFRVTEDGAVCIESIEKNQSEMLKLGPRLLSTK